MGLRAIWSDIKAAISTLSREPGFSITVALALAAGIGANTALFSVINGLLFRPFSYASPDEIVEISVPNRRQHGPVPLESLEKMRTVSPAGVAAFQAFNFQITGSPAAKVTRRFGFRVTPNLFAVLGVDPLLGTGFDTRPGAEPAVMLAYDYWVKDWNSDPNVTSKSVLIGAGSCRIAGVLPANFTLQVRDGNLFVATTSPSPGTIFTDARILARRAPGVTIAQVRSELDAIAGETFGAARREWSVQPLREAFLPGDSAGVIFLQGAVALVLLITCANVGNLLLARSIRRSRELAVRSAMGASAGRIAQLLLIESGLLAAAGGLAGLAFAGAFHKVLETWLPANINRMLRGPDATSIDWNVTTFTIGVSMATVLLFGVAPALRAMRIDVISSLKASSRSTTSGSQRLGQILVSSEVALAVMLLVGAGLLLKSVVRLSTAYLGFDANRVLRVGVDLSPQKHLSPESRIAAYRKIIADFRALPGVESAGVAGPQLFPFGGPRVRGADFAVQGGVPTGGATEPRAEVYTATPEYFATLRIPLLRGRMFDRNDSAESEPVTLISQVVARRTFGDADPVGRRVRFNLNNPGSPWITIIGVVGDVQNPIGADVQPTVYRPWDQNAASGGIFYVRIQESAGSSPMTLAPAIRQVLRDIDPVSPEFRIVDLAESVADYISPQRFSARLLGGFAVFGLLLAGAGVYGVMRYWVQARVPEIGIRVALGAHKGDVVRMVLTRSAIAAGSGGIAGLLAAFAMLRVMDSQLHGVSSADPMVFAGVACLMVLTAMAAAYVPARFASRVDPLIALREE